MHADGQAARGRELDQYVSRVDQQVAEIHARASEDRFDGSDSAAIVTVTVDGAGRTTAVDFAPAAERLPHQVLGAKIVEAHRDARGVAAAEMSTRWRSLVGAE